jgi:hypothetical protein
MTTARIAAIIDTVVAMPRPPIELTGASVAAR